MGKRIKGSPYWSKTNLLLRNSGKRNLRHIHRRTPNYYRIYLRKGYIRTRSLPWWYWNRKRSIPILFFLIFVIIVIIILSVI